MRVLKLLLIAACFSSPATVAQSHAFDPAKVLVEAMAFAQAGETARARQLAEEVRSQNPSRGNIQNELGKLYEKLGDTERAQEAYQRAIRLAPEVEDYYLDLVSLLFLRERPRTAMVLLKKAVQQIPDSYSLTLALGTATQASGEKHQALRIFERAMKSRPDLAPAYVLYGRQATALDQTEAAIRALLTATQIDPNDARARYYLGLALVAAGRPNSEALVEFQRALDINPGYALARYEVAKGLEHDKRITEAIDQYCRALKDDPSLIQVHYRLYMCYSRLGQKDKAQEALRTFRTYQETRRPTLPPNPPG